MFEVNSSLNSIQPPSHLHKHPHATLTDSQRPPPCTSPRQRRLAKPPKPRPRHTLALKPGAARARTRLRNPRRGWLQFSTREATTFQTSHGFSFVRFLDGDGRLARGVRDWRQARDDSEMGGADGPGRGLASGSSRHLFIAKVCKTPDPRLLGSPIQIHKRHNLRPLNSPRPRRRRHNPHIGPLDPPSPSPLFSNSPPPPH